jgi:hypothetical protein
VSQQTKAAQALTRQLLLELGRQLDRRQGLDGPRAAELPDLRLDDAHGVLVAVEPIRVPLEHKEAAAHVLAQALPAQHERVRAAPRAVAVDDLHARLEVVQQHVELDLAVLVQARELGLERRELLVHVGHERLEVLDELGEVGLACVPGRRR